MICQVENETLDFKHNNFLKFEFYKSFVSLLKFTFFSALVSLTTLAANDSNLYMNKSHQIDFGVSKYKYGEYDLDGIRKVDGDYAMTIKATNISIDYSYVLLYLRNHS